MLSHDSKVGEVWTRIAGVTDPELDESVTELGFVTAVTVDDEGGVRIGFRLPTYWCAANFAFLMADDLCRAVRVLPWVGSVSLNLQDHVYADKINHGVAAGLSFQETFAGEAEGNLDQVRETFRRKAYQRRQEAVIRDLLRRGCTVDRVIEMSLVARYLELRRGWNGDADPEARAFVTVEGEALEAGSFTDYLRGLRRIRLNVELNGILCRGLLKARYREEQDKDEDEKPTLLDFALGQVV